MWTRFGMVTGMAANSRSVNVSWCKFSKTLFCRVPRGSDSCFTDVLWRQRIEVALVFNTRISKMTSRNQLPDFVKINKSCEPWCRTIDHNVHWSISFNSLSCLLQSFSKRDFRLHCERWESGIVGSWFCWSFENLEKGQGFDRWILLESCLNLTWIWRQVVTQCYKTGCSWLMLTDVCSMCVWWLAPAADCQFPGCSSWTGAGCSQLERAGCYRLTAEQMRKRPSNCQKPKDSKIAWLPPNLFPIWNPSHFQGKHLQWEQNSLAQECSTLKTDEINYQILSISFAVTHPSEQFSKHRYLLKVS